ncbi:hypothetical protein SAMN05443551_1937 [Marivita hallyeonensis]|uniref:Uncharacterized protein n=1 Tax=Marivita hallyeonensis TaxID=996342 RepID=A0A1M5RY25_9RHOB|nr:hypothetical protein SAMN05443551_1937 [Marivita hallyeonensis]
MSQLRTAISKLSSRTAETVRQARREEHDANSLAPALHALIDETVLPREIALLADGIVSARLSIANRRLNGVTLDPLHKNVKTQPPETANDFASLIRHACTIGHAYTLRPSGRGQAFTENGPSCTGAQLVRALGKASADTLFDTLKPLSTAYLLYGAGGSECEASGPSDLLTALRIANASDADASQEKANRKAKDLPAKPTCLVLPLNETTRIMIAASNQKRAIFAIDEQNVSASARAWMF